MFILSASGDIILDAKLVGDTVCCQGSGNRHTHLTVEQANTLFHKAWREGDPILMPSRETNTLMDTDN